MDEDEIGRAVPPPPPVVAGAVDEMTSVSVRGRGRGRWALGALALVGVVAGVLVLALRGGEVGADEALASAQTVVEGAESFRFEVLETRRLVTGDPDRAGAHMSTRTVTEGVVADPDRWQLKVEEGDPYGMEP